MKCKMVYYILSLLMILVPTTNGDGHLDEILSPCMGMYPINLDDCLDGIREIILDNESTSYAELCPPERSMDMECYTRFPNRNQSIVSALFHPGTFDPDLIDRYLFVNYTSPPGYYVACDYHYEQNKNISFGLDPTQDKTILPWHTRMTPKVYWDVDPGDDKQYTLIIQDVGYGFMHAVYMNIPGTNIEQATVIKEYHGPLNMKKEVNPYAFMLFEQSTKDIDLYNVSGGIWIDIIQNSWMLFNVSDFRDALQMRGPIAMNWILSSFDAYAVQMQSAWGIQNCAGLVEQAIMTSHSERPFFSDMPPLTAFARIMVHTEDISYSYCCHHYFWARSYYLDPIGNASVVPAEARTGSSFTIHMRPRRLQYIPDAFQGKYYTVLCVDPDVPFPTVATQRRPVVHWMVINGLVDDNGELLFGEDDEQLPYLGPRPRDKVPHTYYFLFFEQGDKIDFLDPTKYTGECVQRLTGRCMFDVHMFTEDKNLELVAASWFVSENDEYINMLNDVPLEEGCLGVSCPLSPTTGSSSLHYFPVLPILAMLFHCFYKF